MYNHCSIHLYGCTNRGNHLSSLESFHSVFRWKPNLTYWSVKKKTIPVAAALSADEMREMSVRTSWKMWKINRVNHSGNATSSEKWAVVSAGYVAHTCNPATGRLDGVVDLSLGDLLHRRLRRTGVRTKPGIDMGRLEEFGRSRLF